MTPQEQKELAKFCAEFLGFKEAYHPPIRSKHFDTNWEYDWKDTAVDNFFHDPLFAPHLAHLAKREMEKRGFTWNSFVRETGEYYYQFCVSKDFIPCAEHENEYIALWMAIREAVKG